MESNSMEQFKQSFMNAMKDEEQKKRILDMVKTMTPNFNDQERDKLLELSMKAMVDPTQTTNTSSLPITPLQSYKNDLRRLLALAELPLPLLMIERNRYYTNINLQVPENYDPRTDVSQWDAIDLFETAYILYKENTNTFYNSLLKKYKDWLTSKISI